MKKGNHKGLTGFKPNSQQIAWLKSALKPEVPPVISKIARDCGVNRENWYVWINERKGHVGFNDWWDRVWREGMRRNEYFLDKVGIQKSATDYRYWEGMQMKYHKFKRQGEVTGSVKFEVIESFKDDDD